MKILRHASDLLNVLMAVAFLTQHLVNDVLAAFDPRGHVNTLPYAYHVDPTPKAHFERFIQ